MTFMSIAKEMRNHFCRQGPLYNFGPFPVIWSKKVWAALLSKLELDGTNMLDAIAAHPYESSWYGETLLRYKSIPLAPKEPIFKAYLYLEEYERDLRLNLDESALEK